ncbi:hypothetical protein HMPREF9952_0097 [Haemophilus pittmaniae HK 85]|uniref:UPF0352 protein HMPREF9952_0097 n=1 Tax=Haemophilus pittmaniae HK 85 TaxID=1035188 RepID=F9Q890_9PAST|nr:hypothetical protein HMPREF9952_0097 [Haemophilus pittmaniae HK 85]
MAQRSKYSDAQVNAIAGEMIGILENHKAPADLALIVLGNLASNILTANVPVAQREAVAQAFANSLINAIKNNPMWWFKKGFNGREYREETSRKISWGHWFAFLISSSQFLLVPVTPFSSIGRIL